MLDSPEALARCNGWTEEVNRDLLALQQGTVTQDEVDRKYLYRKAILTLEYFAVRTRTDVSFEQLASDDQLFPYYRVSPSV
jgi:hypothetical protein